MDGVWIANDNSDGQSVISGTHNGIAQATEGLMAAGARKVVPLAVAGPFHSPLMGGAQKRFAEAVARVAFEDARIPVVQNDEPTPAREADLIRQRLLEQISAPVRWRETMSAVRAEGIDTVVETGPGGVLAGLARRVAGLAALAVETDGVDRIVEVLA
jgi:[acyl-carrier-protein] S-malonyltransferase